MGNEPYQISEVATLGIVSSLLGIHVYRNESKDKQESKLMHKVNYVPQSHWLCRHMKQQRKMKPIGKSTKVIKWCLHKPSKLKYSSKDDK